jgi:branched-chain amino acid aminotransferase
MQSKYIWLNGKLVNYSEASLHFLTPGLHYGVAAFEGIRCYRTTRGPAIFRLREHIERLVGSCKVLGWKQLPFDAAQLIEACRVTVQVNGFQECYLRPLIYQAEGGWNLSVDFGKPHVGIAVWEWSAYLGPEAQEKGVRANVSSFTRHQPNVMMTKAKIAGNYPNSVLAKTESMRLGFDEAIMLDCQGMVAECTGENIFVVIDGRILTPPEANILAGITRDSLIHLAGDLGYPSGDSTDIPRPALYRGRGFRVGHGGRSHRPARNRLPRNWSGKNRSDHSSAAGSLSRRRQW